MNPNDPPVNPSDGAPLLLSSPKKGDLISVFVDEGGDADIPGNERYFVLAAAAFQTETHRNEMEEAIRKLREGWGKLKNNEFKFSRLDHAGRTKFFVAVGDRTFKHCSCVLRKERLAGQWKKKAYVYERVIREVVGGLTPFFRELDAAQSNPLRVRVYFDQHTDSNYRRTLEREFRKLHSKDGSAMIKDVTQGRSDSSRLLQLADMLSGAARWDSNDFSKYVAAQCLRSHVLP
jgi:hypothetical protein